MKGLVWLLLLPCDIWQLAGQWFYWHPCFGLVCLVTACCRVLLDFERENYQLPAISPRKKGKKGNDNAVHSLAAGIWSLWPADSSIMVRRKIARQLSKRTFVVRIIQYRRSSCSLWWVFASFCHCSGVPEPGTENLTVYFQGNYFFEIQTRLR